MGKEAEVSFVTASFILRHMQVTTFEVAQSQAPTNNCELSIDTKNQNNISLTTYFTY